MTFKDCKNAGSCGKDLCLPEFCKEFEYVQKTNAERIRSMNNEELAEFLERTNSSMAIRLGKEYIVRDREYIEIWLQQYTEER